MSQLMREILSHAVFIKQVVHASVFIQQIGGGLVVVIPALLAQAFFQSLKLFRGDAGAAKLAQDTFFQHRPQKDSVVQAVDRDPADLGAALGENLYAAFLSQAGNRLAHGSAAGTHLGCQGVFTQELSGQEGEVNDAVPKLAVSIIRPCDRWWCSKLWHVLYLASLGEHCCILDVVERTGETAAGRCAYKQLHTSTIGSDNKIARFLGICKPFLTLFLFFCEKV